MRYNLFKNKYFNIIGIIIINLVYDYLLHLELFDLTTDFYWIVKWFVNVLVLTIINTMTENKKKLNLYIILSFVVGVFSAAFSYGGVNFRVIANLIYGQ
ncbi:MAG: hypothetical protein KAX49_11640 [Halanaerobiales bacterium]|nr:hypothetical protein [Halanaerobiales bacterium]